MDNGKRSISPRDLYFWIAVSIFAASFSCGANAQKINWPCRVTCTDMAFRAPISP